MGCCGKAQGIFERAQLPAHVQNLLRRSQGGAPNPMASTGAKRRFRQPPRQLQPPIAYFGPPPGTGAMDPRLAQLGAAMLPFAPAAFPTALVQVASELDSLAARLESVGFAQQAASVRGLANQFRMTTQL